MAKKTIKSKPIQTNPHTRLYRVTNDATAFCRAGVEYPVINGLVEIPVHETFHGSWLDNGVLEPYEPEETEG